MGSVDKTLLSIVIPVFQTHDFIMTCVKPLLADTGREFEVICVDDGSTDGSAELLDSLAAGDDRLKVIHQQNRGVSAARNAGINRACGRYVSFIDSDDIPSNTYVEVLTSYINSNDDDLVLFSGYSAPSEAWVDELVRVHPGSFEGPQAVLDALLTQPGATPFVWNKLFKRSIIKHNELHFDETFKIGEDVVFLFGFFALTQSCTFIESNLYEYRTSRDDSAMANHQLATLEGQIGQSAILRKIVQSWSRQGLMDTYGVVLLISLSYLFSDFFALSGRDAVSFSREIVIWLKQEAGESFAYVSSCRWSNIYWLMVQLCTDERDEESIRKTMHSYQVISRVLNCRFNFLKLGLAKK